MPSLETRAYRAYKKLQKFVLNPSLAKYSWDVQADYRTTKRQLGKDSWHSTNNSDPRRQVLIVSRSNIPYLLKAHALMAKSLQLRGHWPVILTSASNRLAPKYFELFGLNDIVYWDIYNKEHQPSEQEVDRVVSALVRSKPSVQEIKKWKFRGVLAARHALSTIIRSRLQGQFTLTNPLQSSLFERYLREAVANVLIAERFFDSRSILKCIVRDAGYTPNGELYEVGLKRGIDCTRVEMGQLRGCWLMKRYTSDTLGRALFSLSESTWEQLCHIPLTPEQEADLEANIKDRYNPSCEKDMYKYQAGKQEIPREEVCRRLGLDPKKKTAIIFSHITWDASFFDGEDLYDDYEQWLVETVRVACQNPRLNWVIKLHPANVFKLKRERSKSEKQETELVALRHLGPFPDHIKILHADTEINTVSLFPLIDFGITVRGTIGMELPMDGIPVLTAGTGRYDGFGFTIDSSTRQEYEARLRSLPDLPRLTNAQRELARRHCYWLLIRRQVSFEDIAPATAMAPEAANHPLHYNLQIQASSTQHLQDSPSFKAFTDWFLNSSQPDLIR